MTLPGFTAEAALTQDHSTHYVARFIGRSGIGVEPARSPILFCGECDVCDPEVPTRCVRTTCCWSRPVLNQWPY